jgi:nicotinamide mononucleotide transporter
VVLALCATATAALAALLAAGTDSRVPLGDAATTVCSLAANFWLARRRTDNWPLWIAGVNAPYFALYLYKGLALTASLQVVFIIFSVIGWRTWRREMAGGARHLPAGALAGGMA